MQIRTEEEIQEAAARIAVALLKEQKKETYDLRDFEYIATGVHILKVDMLLRSIIDHSCIKEEIAILEGATRVQKGIPFILQLCKA